MICAPDWQAAVNRLCHYSGLLRWLAGSIKLIKINILTNVRFVNSTIRYILGFYIGKCYYSYKIMHTTQAVIVLPVCDSSICSDYSGHAQLARFYHSAKRYHHLKIHLSFKNAMILHLPQTFKTYIRNLKLYFKMVF